MTTTTTVRPSSHLSATGWGAFGGSLPALLADNSDSTYLTVGPTPTATYLREVVTAVTLPQLAQVRLVTLRIRVSCPGTDCSITANVYGTGIGIGSGSPYAALGPLAGTLNASLQTLAVGSSAVKNDGSAFSAADLSFTPGYDLTSTASASLQVYELYVDYTYSSAPTATITAPTPSQVFTVTKPTFSWTYAGDAAIQERYKVWVLTPAQVTAVTSTITTKAITQPNQNSSPIATLTTSAPHSYVMGAVVIVSGVDSTFNGNWVISAVTSNTFSYAIPASLLASTAASGTAVSPNGVTAAWYSGEVFSSLTSVVCGVSLVNASYSVYVTVADQGSSGRYGAFVSQAFSVNAPIPNAATGSVATEM